MFKFLHSYKNFIFASLCIIFFIFLHSYHITQIPAGLYLDETSIGLNAATISSAGTDEYGQKFPIYFKAFGEWKNPLYIYTSAIIFKIFGISEFHLRLTSIFFFAIFLCGIYAFSRKIFKKNISVSHYSLLIAGTLPWFFTLSRISFEVISQIAIAIWLFYFLYISYCEKVNNLNNLNYSNYSNILKKNIYPLVSGLFLALFLYSYSTSRVLAFGIILALFLSFYQKKYWKTHFILMISFFIFILPYIYFSYIHSGALTSRFELLTYLYDEKISVLEKISIFFRNYFSAFDISNFLLFQGDLNIRHSSGYMGQLFFIPFVLFLVGFSGTIQKFFSHNNQSLTDEKNKIIKNKIINNKIIKEKKIQETQETQETQSKKYWRIFLFLILLGSPLPAALTSDIHHSLRLLFFGLMICIFSFYGYNIVIEKYTNKPIKRYVIAGIFFGIFFQSVFYFQNYFSEEMKNKTIFSFGGYELQEAIEWANSQNATAITFYEHAQNPLYASIKFYNHILGTDVEINNFPAQKNSCHLWYKWNAPQKKLPPVSIFRGDKNGIISGACY